MDEETKPAAQPPARPKPASNAREIVRLSMQMGFIVALMIMALFFGQMSKACEISSFMQYVDSGGRVEVNESGVYDYGKPAVPAALPDGGFR